jgi:hypothetical protein
VPDNAARHLYVEGSRVPRPPSRRAVFCDGGIDATYRDDVDLELSHWIPNSTPARFKASTSTEICIKYMEATEGGDFDLVVNNHTDVDGVLSTFVLMHPDLALAHRETLVQAAEMGDFGGWGELPAQHICQGLLCLIARLADSGVDPLAIYMQCYQRVRDMLAGERFAECVPGMAALQASVARIEAGSILRLPLANRFVHYVIPQELARHDLDAALYAPTFDMPFSSTALLPPNVRARFDKEKVQLVSVQTGAGHYHDLWYPGYTWAETVDLWLAPGVTSAGSSNVHYLNHPPLAAAVGKLQQLETADGHWALARRLSPFGSVEGRNFPIVLSFMRDAKPAPSKLPIAIVREILAPLYASL